MLPRHRALGAWLRRRAENILAAVLGVMFTAFMVQIVFRYLLNFPLGWTFELTTVMWLWLVLWGAAFVVTEREEIRFDLIYATMGRRTRLFVSLITGVFLIVIYLISFPAVWDYVTFMKVEHTAYMHIPFDLLYLIYPIFAVAVIIRYVWLLTNAFFGKAPEAFDPTKASSGL
jgi:TRAP-type C4-dicarboxylate transport system permease small subunit